MFLVILLALLAVPVIELYLIVEVAGGIGVPETIALLILISLAGAWLVRREGLGVLARVDQRLQRGELPTHELVDGLCVLVAGALMLTPGFLTDAVGLLLLVPFTRAPLRLLLERRFRRRMDRYQAGDAPRSRVWVTSFTNVTDVDVDGVRERPTSPRRGSRPDVGPPPELGQG
ncbi:MAG: FxsA family protein [Acidimicrobiia bacterium]|nr:FxsA family protein [Acidimicrobiia bacterium]